MIVNIQNENQQLQFLSYEAVDLIGTEEAVKVANREEFTTSLSNLAIRTNSVIARRIVEPQKVGKLSLSMTAMGKENYPQIWNRLLLRVPKLAIWSIAISSLLVI